MKNRSRFSHFVAFFVSCCFLALPAVWATPDDPDYRLSINPDFQLSGESYGTFETAEFPIEAPLNNMLVSVDTEVAPAAVLRAYARFKNKRTGLWTRYKEFEGEFHYGDLDPISAFQVMFIVRDPGKGKTVVQRIFAQGVQVPVAMMEWLKQAPIKFEALKPWAKPAIVSRKDWGARPPKSTYTPHKPLRLVIHHSWKPAQAQYAGASTIRGIQNYHMDGAETGWTDIGYHFLIGHDGKIYQGRPETVVGAHASPNTNAVGICCLGNYDPGADQVTPAMEKALVDLLSWLSATYEIDPRTQYFGHRDFSTKSCPGDMVYQRLPEYREQVLKNIVGKK